VPNLWCRKCMCADLDGCRLSWNRFQLPIKTCRICLVSKAYVCRIGQVPNHLETILKYLYQLKLGNKFMAYPCTWGVYWCARWHRRTQERLEDICWPSWQGNPHIRPRDQEEWHQNCSFHQQNNHSLQIKEQKKVDGFLLKIYKLDFLQ